MGARGDGCAEECTEGERDVLKKWVLPDQLQCRYRYMGEIQRKSELNISFR